MITECDITPIEYSTLYPLFVFDISKHEVIGKVSTVDLRIEVTFNENVSANTQAYALIHSEAMELN